MSNFDTVSAITDNLQEALKKQGIHFSKSGFDDPGSIPASLLPLGRIFYAGESFEYAHGQRPSYAEVEYSVRVLLAEKDPAEMMREQQRWTHRVRDAMTIDALNTGELAIGRPVSRVMVAGVSVVNDRHTASLVLRTVVRYREQ